MEAGSNSCPETDMKGNWILCKGIDRATDIPTAPADWEAPPVNSKKGEPKFEEVDNPGEWSEFTYRPKFEGEKGGGNKHITAYLLVQLLFL